MQFEQQLKDKFREAEMPVRPEVWERIKSNLTPPTPRNPWGGKRLLVLILWVCVAAMGGYGVWTLRKQPQHETVLSSTSQPTAPLISPRVKGIAEEIPQAANAPAVSANTMPTHTHTTQSKRLFSSPSATPDAPTHVAAAHTQSNISPSLSITSDAPTQVAAAHTQSNISPSSSATSDAPTQVAAAHTQSNISPSSSPQIVPTALSLAPSVPNIVEAKLVAGEKIPSTVPQLPTQSSLDEKPSSKSGFVTFVCGEGGRQSVKIRKWHYQVGLGTASIVYGNELYKQTGRIQALSVASINAGEDVYSNIQVDNDTLLGMIANNVLPAEGVLRMTYSDATQFIRAGVQYQLRPRLSIGTGLSLYRQNVRRMIYTLPNQTTEISLKDLISINTSESIALNQVALNPNSIRTQIYKVAVAEIPLHVQYVFLQKKRNSLHVEGGTSVRFLINSGRNSLKRASLDSYYLPTSNDNLIANFYQPVNFTARMGVGYNYDLTARQSLYIQATATKLLQNMYWQGVSISRPLMIGVEAGVKF